RVIVQSPSGRQAKRRADFRKWTGAPIEYFIIEVVRENWTPPEPPVDPDLLAFREWLMKREPDMRRQSYAYDADFWDNCLSAQAYLAGARMAREQERERAGPLVEFVEDHSRRLDGVGARALLKEADQ
ncbi:MAG: hypothetical protein ACK5X3_02805, partial [Pseudomonadota bacterium]